MFGVALDMGRSLANNDVKELTIVVTSEKLRVWTEDYVCVRLWTVDCQFNLFYKNHSRSAAVISTFDVLRVHIFYMLTARMAVICPLSLVYM